MNVNLEQINEKAETLRKRLEGYMDKDGQRVSGILEWIKKNPGTDPNVYEIMDCNIEYAEVLAMLRAYYDQNGYPIITDRGVKRRATVNDLPHLHSALAGCFMGLAEMDALRDVDHHPFFKQPEANSMYCSIKISQLNLNYVVPTDPGLQRIKKEMLCKSMSVPFYIWQVQRRKPTYQYDNKAEFEGMQEAFALYQETEQPPQFAKLVQALHNKIDDNYKYSAKEDSTNKNTAEQKAK